MAAVSLWLYGDPAAPGLAYAAAALALVYGSLLAVSAPGALRNTPRGWMWRAVADVCLISLLVAASGGAASPFSAIYLLAGLGAIHASTPGGGWTMAGLTLAGYLAAVLAGTGSFEAPLAGATVLGSALLVLVCLLSGKVGSEMGRLRRESSDLEAELASEGLYGERLSSNLAGLGPALGMLPQEDVLQWAAGAAREAVGARYAHVAMLEGNLHRTVADEELEACPGWWHPEVQRLVLWSSRSGETLRRESEAPGIESFTAVPMLSESGSGVGALLAGGGETGDDEERILRTIADQASRALSGRTESPAGRDPVSRLPNQDSLRRVLHREVSCRGTFTLLCAELDGMQRYAGNRSPAAAESLLRSVGEGLESGQQRAFKLDSSAIAVLVSGGNGARVHRAALGLRARIEAVATGYGITVRIGIAPVGDGAYRPEEALPAARRAAQEARLIPEGIAYAHQNLEEAENGEPLGGLISALVEATDAHDSYLGDHMRAVSYLAGELGKQLGLEERRLQTLTTGALLHDVGKIGLPQSLLQKPSSLSPEEYETVKLHPELGVRILGPAAGLAHILPVVRHHHERYDGGGYPDGLRGEEIPLEARITFVADALDSMVRDRAYRRGLPTRTAVREISGGSGTQFDPDVVSALIALLESDELRLAT